MTALARIIPDQDDGLSNAVPALRSDLHALTVQVDASFNAASEQLGHAASKIESIVSALTQVASMFDGGVGAEAVDGLKQAAGSLMTIQAVVDQRSSEISTMHEAARALRDSARDVLRCLQVLDVYGLNVKITASGLQQFMDFADAMRLKLGQGSQELRGLDHMLEALDISLNQMSQTDRRLIAECSKVIPQVPDSLLHEAGNLQAHHARLTELAQSIAIVARSIQTELYAAIQAIQIGDRVRQRLEHVLAGLVMIDQQDGDGPLSEGVVVHVRAVLAALCDGAAAEYRRDIIDLVASLGRLQGQCDKLAGLHRAQEGDGGGDGDMLGRIEASVADAHEMLKQLDRADSEGLATLDMILRTVDEVAERAEAIALLRLDVQHMAINIGLNCRSAERIGRPVMVIANEIRSYSNRLDAIADTIHADQASLSNPCHRIREQSREHKHASSEVLQRFITVIGECSEGSKRAAAMVEHETIAMRSALASAIGALSDATAYSMDIGEVSVRLHPAEPMLHPVDEGDAAVLQTMLDALARTYTMAEEREVHNAHLPPGLTSIASVQAPPQGVDDDEDDGLF